MAWRNIDIDLDQLITAEPLAHRPRRTYAPPPFGADNTIGSGIRANSEPGARTASATCPAQDRTCRAGTCVETHGAGDRYELTKEKI